MRRQDYERQLGKRNMQKSQKGAVQVMTEADTMQVVSASRPGEDEMHLLLLMCRDGSNWSVGFPCDREAADQLIEDLITARNTIWPGG